MKKFTLFLGLILTVCLMAFVGCKDLCTNHVDTDKDGVCDNCGGKMTGYAIEILTEDLTVYESQTATISVYKTPEEATVTYASSNNEIATVAQDGTITAIKAGEATITATVKEGVSDTMKVTVKARTISIEALEKEELYTSKTLQLTAKVLPEGTTYTWTSSDEEVATVSETGLVTAIKAGEVTLTATVNDTLKASVTLTVKDTVVKNSINADKFDFSGIYQDEAVVKSNGKQNSYAVLNGTAGKYYVATAKVVITDPASDDTWSRVGISHFNGTDSYYGLQLSPGANFSARKTITMVVKDGGVQWGTITDRSQVWNRNLVAQLDFTKAIKLTAVRQGSKYYAYINDILYYYDEGMSGFDDVDTIPVLNLGSCTAEYTAISAQFGEDAVTAFLATADKSAFYTTSANETIENGTIKFVNADNQNPKDHAAKSVGGMAMLAANVEGTVEFDLTIDSFGSKGAMPALAVTINRYDSACNQARSLIIAQYKAGWTGWDSNGDLNAGIGSGGKAYSLNNEDARLEEGSTYHVTFTRLMYADGQDTKLQIKDSKGNVLLEDAHGWQDGYKGRVVVSFLCRDINCTIANLSISSQQA